MPNNVKNFSMQSSKQGYWCWAAVAASVSASVGGTAGPSGGPRQQCEIASSVLNQTTSPTCCDAPESDICNVGAALEDALSCIGHSTLGAGAEVPGPMNFKYIQGQIDAQLPVPVRIGWCPDPDDLGHYVCITGYDETALTVDVADPQDDPNSGPKTYPIDQFSKSYRLHGQWTNTYPIK